MGGASSGSWPTPDAQVMNDGENPETFYARREKLKATARNGNAAGHCGAGLEHASARASQSGLGGAPHGMADGMEWPAAAGLWPYRRGEAQASLEAPRTTTTRAQRIPRMKALGNGWVPQCAVEAWRRLTS